MDKHKGMTSTKFVLLGLVPYTRQNMMLSCLPNKFFNELEAISKYSQNDLKRAYSRSVERGYIMQDESGYSLSAEARALIAPLVAEELGTNTQLMVAFDIPEDLAQQRRAFRYTLKRLEFEQVQRSVWMSKYNYTDIITTAINDLHIKDFVKVFVAAPVKI